YGINLSRLLTESALKQNRGYSTLSTGRVQGPTLKFVVQREEEIQCFTPTPFWAIKATIRHEDQTYSLQYEKEKIPTLAEATQIIVYCKNALLEVANIETQTIPQSTQPGNRPRQDSSNPRQTYWTSSSRDSWQPSPNPASSKRQSSFSRRTSTAFS